MYSTILPVLHAVGPDDYSGDVAVEIVLAAPTAEATTTSTRDSQRGTKRPLYIRPGVELQKFGFTPGCQGCDAVKFNYGYRLQHSEACRERIGKLVDQDGELKRRGEEARKRMASGAGDNGICWNWRE